MAEQVEVGQVWADNDWRSEGRRVKVIAIEGTHAIVELVAVGRGQFVGSIGRRSRIRLDRMKPNSTGYRLTTEETTHG